MLNYVPNCFLPSAYRNYRHISDIPNPSKIDKEIEDLTKLIEEFSKLLEGKVNLSCGIGENIQACAADAYSSRKLIVAVTAFLGSIAGVSIFGAVMTKKGEKLQANYDDFLKLCAYFNSTLQDPGYKNACDSNTTVIDCCQNATDWNANCTDTASDDLSNICKLNDQEYEAFKGIFASVTLLVFALIMSCYYYNRNNAAVSDEELACVLAAKDFSLEKKDKESILTILTSFKTILGNDKITKIIGHKHQAAFDALSGKIEQFQTRFTTSPTVSMETADVRDLSKLLCDSVLLLSQINEKIPSHISARGSINPNGKVTRYGTL